MGPFPTCKGPEGDKLQGTIVHLLKSIYFKVLKENKKLNFWIPNFMPNFKKIVRAVFWENVSRTAGQPDKSHFIGPFPVNRRPNKLK